jgi:VWFA-related protein
VKNRFTGITLGLFLFLLTGSLLFITGSQESREKQPKRRTFGFSLKRPHDDAIPASPTRTKDEEIEELQSRAASETLKVDTLVAVFDFLVVDVSGKPVGNLKKEDFVVSEDSIPQEISLFTRGDDTRQPRSIILIIEWSNTAHYIENSLAAAQKFVDQLGPQDQLAIVRSDIKLLCDFTNDKRDLKAALQILQDQISGKSGDLPAEVGLPPQQFEFETLLAVLQELIAGSARHIIIFQADGGESLYLRDQALVHHPIPPPERKISLAEVLSVVKKSRATIYSIIPDFQYVGLPEGEQIDRARRSLKAQIGYLSESEQHWLLSKARLKNFVDSAVIGQRSLLLVAGLSGGWSSFLERPEFASNVYSRILADANQRYVIAYNVADKTRDGRLRSVKIRVRSHPEYLVQGRESYSIP